MKTSYGVCQNRFSVVHLLGPARLHHLQQGRREGLVCNHLDRLTVRLQSALSHPGHGSAGFARSILPYKINKKGHLKLLQEEKAPCGENAPVLRTWKGMESMVITENIPQEFLSTPHAHAALFFWSSIATLRVQHEDVRFPSERKVYGSNDLEFAARWKQLPASLSETSNVFSAVVVGDTDTWGGHKDYLNITLVSWVESIAYREGMLSMLETNWVKLDRTWRQITLC